METTRIINNEEKIWVSPILYILVDNNGYVTGPCFEGMLGCVLQIRDEGGRRFALKIPRLLADTIEENAYICQTIEAEMRAVESLMAKDGSASGLFPAETATGDLLSLRRETSQREDKHAKNQDKHVIFISFERDKKPRLCAVDYDRPDLDDGMSIFPEGCKSDFMKNVSKTDWGYFSTPSTRVPTPFSRAMFRSYSLAQEIDELENALEPKQRPCVWYVAIPSIIFKWATETLQESITRGGCKDWELKNHFDMFEQVLMGVCFLHRSEMIHGDIRPANVLRIGMTLPAKYRLGDYGSYGKEWQAFGKRELNRTSDGPEVGPAIGSSRETPFYSPERRAGNEFESANVAIIKRIDESDASSKCTYLLLLGWRSNLISDSGQEVKPSIDDVIKELLTTDIPTQPDGLTEGDRIRIRNYLFEVIRSGIKELKDEKGHVKFYLCSKQYAEILHDRLIIYKKDPLIGDTTIIDVSNYVEFHKWSAATDLYSVGAMCLYCLFSCGLQNQSTDSSTISGDNPDTQFVEMIEILESVPYFQFFWQDLENFRRELESCYKEKPQKIGVARNHVSKETKPDGQTLFDIALHATNNILHSTPKAKIILKQFDMNLAHFLLFMHFALACLHRGSHMKPEKQAADSISSAPDAVRPLDKPFAKDRREEPTENGAARAALHRLQELKHYLAQPFFDDFTCSVSDEILDFDPRSDFRLRIEFGKEEAKSAQLEAQLTSVKSDLSTAVEKEELKNAQLEAQLTSVRNDLSITGSNLGLVGNDLIRVKTELDRVKNELGRVKNELKTAADTPFGLRKELKRIVESMKEIEVS